MLLLLLLFINIFTEDKIFQWAVVGAGPAGITAVSVLLESGVDSQDISWIDPSFAVGNLSLYPEVPANTGVLDFLNFFRDCKYFKVAEKIYNKLENQDFEPYLKDIIAPLQAITFYLKSLTNSKVGFVTKLEYQDNWHIFINGKKDLISKNVILAIGSYPVELNNNNKAKIIPLEVALNKDSVAGYLKPEDTVVVYGNSHSAILVLKNLSELNINKIINIYKHELVYCDFSFDPPIYQGSGLKGLAARWAKEFLETNLISNLTKIKLEDLDQDVLESADKIIYAIGFKPNLIENIEIKEYKAGEIATGLFGLGIAFPETIIDQSGSTEQLIGLDSFMNYARNNLPNFINKRDKLGSINYYNLDNLIKISLFAQ